MTAPDIQRLRAAFAAAIGNIIRANHLELEVIADLISQVSPKEFQP